MAAEVAPQPASMGTVTTVAMSTMGSAQVLLWLLKCWKAHELLIPDENVAMVTAAFFSPMLHSFAVGVTSVINACVRWLGGNGSAPPLPSQSGAAP